MSSPAGISRHPLAFCPDHSGEKSSRPWLSALARNGASADDASGKSGTAVLTGPSSRMRRFTMPRAGRPLKTIRQSRVPGGLASERRPVHGAGRGFRAEQVGCSNLDAGGAKGHRRRDAFRVRDAAGGDHRERDRLHDLRDQRERSDLGAQVVRQEHAAVPAGLEPLGDDRIDAVRFEPPRFVDGGRRREIFEPPARTRASSSADGRPK